MNHVKTYELFNFFKKKPKDPIDIDLLKDLLESDLYDVNFRGVDVLTVIKFEKCRFRGGSNGLPNLTRDEWFGQVIGHSATGYYNGVDGILMNYDVKLINNIRKQKISDIDRNELDFRDIFNLTRKVLSSINKDRMSEYGIGFCINKHHYIGDGIVFYRL